MDATTIKIHGETKKQLDKLKEYKNETYDEVIKKMAYIIGKLRTEPELSQQTVQAIEAARKRMKAGNLVTEKEAKERLGF